MSFRYCVCWFLIIRRSSTNKRWVVVVEVVSSDGPNCVCVEEDGESPGGREQRIGKLFFPNFKLGKNNFHMLDRIILSNI